MPEWTFHNGTLYVEPGGYCLDQDFHGVHTIALGAGAVVCYCNFFATQPIKIEQVGPSGPRAVITLCYFNEGAVHA